MKTYSIFAPDFVSNQSTFSLRRVWAEVGALRRSWETRRQLIELDNRLSADIAASRADAVVEASRPFWHMR